jgi:hypothetical protein
VRGITNSRAMAGVLDPAALEEKLDINGSTLLEAAREAGYGADSHASMVQGARILPGKVSAFVELHIEQVRRLRFCLVLG